MAVGDYSAQRTSVDVKFAPPKKKEAMQNRKKNERFFSRKNTKKEPIGKANLISISSLLSPIPSSSILLSSYFLTLFSTSSLL